MRQRILGLSSDEVDIVDDEGKIDEKHDTVGEEVYVGALEIEDVAIDRYDVVFCIGVVGMVDDKGERVVGEKHDFVGEHGVYTGEEVDMEVLEVDIWGTRTGRRGFLNKAAHASHPVDRLLRE